MKAIKILFIMTLSLNAISVNRALFDLKDSQLKGELTPKIVDFGGYKSSTAIKILFIMTLSLNAISVNRALFDLKDSQLKGELTPKIVDFGGYKSST
ncbi:hypothetical protein, partial [Helicobacter pylori]|uniref:hypothetical protein n=1 Tax=Helicobacter pylori TaxID=210 RepID=UPI000FBCD0B4